MAQYDPHPREITPALKAYWATVTASARSQSQKTTVSECPLCDGRGSRGFAVKYVCIPDGSAPHGFRMEECEAIPVNVSQMEFYEQYPGYAYAEGPCECRIQRNAANRLLSIMEEPDIPQDCLKFTFDDFSGQALKYAKQLVSGVVYDEVDDTTKRGLLITGPTGTGKTTLASLVFRAYAERGVTVVWTDFNQLIKRIRATYDDGYTGPSQNQIVEAALSAQFLMLDDLGSGTRSEQRRNSLYAEDAIEAVRQIFNHRLVKQLPTVVTTNLSKEQLYEQFGDRVISRLRGLCAGAIMFGADFRAPGDR